MRRSIPFIPLLFATALAATACSGCGNASDDGAPGSESAAVVNAEVVDFDVEGMTCASCEVSIKMVLEKVDGVIEVSADADAGSAQARFDPAKTDATVLAAAITKLGYAATVRTAAAGGR